MRGRPGTSRTPAGPWRVAAVAVLLAVTVAGLRSRGPFSHAPDRALAGASGAVLAIVLGAAEGVALIAFVIVLAAPAGVRADRRAAGTPAEVLARATGAGLVSPGPAARMAALFRRARYSSEPMTSADSSAAAAALDQMQAGLAAAGAVR